MARARRCAGLLVASLVLATAARGAGTIVWGFDELAPTATVGQVDETGELTSITSEVEGVTVTIVRTAAGFDLAEIPDPALFPPGWAPIAIDPFAFDETDDAFVATFSEPMSAASVSLTDFDLDEDLATLEAFAEPDAAGAPVASDSAVFPELASAPDAVTLAVEAPVIRSVRFRGGSAAYPNSMYADRLTATPAPEPAGAAAALAAALALVALRCGSYRPFV